MAENKASHGLARRFVGVRGRLVSGGSPRVGQDMDDEITG